MRILCIGNSITAGNTGVSFVRMMRAANPDWKIVNKGINGEPLYNIGDRLIRHLKKDPLFDRIVIEAGINDLLLPALEKRGGLYRFVIGRERKHEIRPLEDPGKFRKFYSVLLKEARLYTRASIVLVNISRINEGASPQSIGLQSEYNSIIASLAAQANYSLADVASLFDEALGSPGENRDYLCENFWSTSFWDGLRCYLPGQADKLSAARKLRLTIDGVHLNTAGARLYATAISRALKTSARIIPVQGHLQQNFL
ncbi:MAG: hypothetical protein EOO05_00365 [Chitinophagaceae bacterium]|nr:MAG: hypothetical protein EOO05_00365 [Chitinophagaceae bacterium]